MKIVHAMLWVSVSCLCLGCPQQSEQSDSEKTQQTDNQSDLEQTKKSENETPKRRYSTSDRASAINNYMNK